MRSTGWRTAAAVLAGAVVGTLAGELLAHQVSFLRQQTAVRWAPAADWGFIRFALDLTFRVNWMTLAGVIVAYFLSRRR